MVEPSSTSFAAHLVAANDKMTTINEASSLLGYYVSNNNVLLLVVGLLPLQDI
jgi:hypothetical protein